MQTARCRAFVYLLVSCAASVAHATEPTNTEIAVARSHFDRAVAAENEGRWRDAIEDLNKAIAIKETAGLRYHLGFAKENLGLLVEAMLEYERAAGLIRSGVTTEEIQRFLTPKLEEVRKRVPRLTVQIPPDVKDAELRIDGTPVKRELLGTPLPLNPGTHALVVFASGRRPFHVQVSLGEGTAVSQAVELVPDAVSPVGPVSTTRPPEPNRPQPVAVGSGSGRTWTLIAESAVVAAGLGVGVGYLIASSAAQHDIDDAQARVGSSSNACEKPSLTTLSDCTTLANRIDEPDHDRKIAAAGFVVAGLGVAVLAATWMLWKPADAAISIGPSVGRNTAGLSLIWRH